MGKPGAKACTMEKMQSERQIWQAFKKGDRDALALIFTAYYPLLHHYGLQISRDSALTEDLLQDFFLYLYERRENLSDLDSPRAYLFTSFRRMLLRKLKSASQQSVALDEVSGAQPFVQFSVEELQIKGEEATFRVDILIRTLNKLPGRQREVIYLRYYNDMSLTEIAEVMSITYQGVANTLQKAFNVLRKDVNVLKMRELGILLVAMAMGLSF